MKRKPVQAALVGNEIFYSVFILNYSKFSFTVFDGQTKLLGKN